MVGKRIVSEPILEEQFGIGSLVPPDDELRAGPKPRVPSPEEERLSAEAAFHADRLTAEMEGWDRQRGIEEAANRNSGRIARNIRKREQRALNFQGRHGDLD